MESKTEEMQRAYYAATAREYDRMHMNTEHVNEHDMSLSFLSSFVELFKYQSILDVGAGTGRAISFLESQHPELRVVGIEPVAELRLEGIKKGIAPDKLLEGSGYKLDFKDGEFDVVCEFGILHHVEFPEKVIAEMLRVAKKAIFISDSNNFGQGGRPARIVKQVINSVGLWKIFDLIKTRGRGYHYSDGDGVFYSYSVFNNYNQIKKACSSINFFSAQNDGYNLYRSSSHVAILAEKKQS